MAHWTLAAVVKALRFRYALVIVLLLSAVYWLAIRPWMADWGSTPAEQSMPLPGDELYPAGTSTSTLALTINAPADVVWQWLVQIGQDRAGFYTYTWLENLLGVDIHNADEIHPEWQKLAVGDGWRLVPADYLGGLGADAVMPVLISEPGRALVVEMFGAHVIDAIDEQTSRLLVRGQTGPANLMQTMLIDPVVFTLERRMLLGLKARAEGRPDAPAVLMTIAVLGWAAAGITVAALFLSRRRFWYWMALPTAAALPALVMSGDIQAGLAAFISVGVIVLGFLIFGRDWWGPLLVIGSAVLLVLLLAPEAYTAIGFTFAFVFLAAVTSAFVTRSREKRDMEGRLATPR